MSEKRKRPEPRQTRRQREKGTLPGDQYMAPVPRPKRNARPLEPQTDAQHAYINAINVYDLIFADGPAGTGKTYIAAMMAAEAFERGEIDHIMITRPAVGAEEEYGFLPGELEEKIAPWAAPVIKILEERLGGNHVEYLLKAKKIEIMPLGMLRGHTFNDAFILFDEAQNATPNQMKLFLTRIGKNTTVVVDGDLAQQDIEGPSGFADAMRVMEGHPQVGFVHFDIDDIVRSGLCRDILIRYAERKAGTVGQAELRRVLGHRPD